MFRKDFTGFAVGLIIIRTSHQTVIVVFHLKLKLKLIENEAGVQGGGIMGVIINPYELKKKLHYDYIFYKMKKEFFI